jgi:ribonuclease HII
MPGPDFHRESSLLARGTRPVAGVDEAGRGPLAGPVVAAAVILDPGRIPPGLDDSKKLKAAARESLAAMLAEIAQIGVGLASVEEIDRFDILRASHLAMRRAVAALPEPPGHVLVDGNLIPRDFGCPAAAVIGGDALCLSIAAASIVAKVTRDRIMVDLAQQHPGYGWERNKGYPTKSHKAAMIRLGVTPHHRRSFAPVHNILYQAQIVSA